MKKQIDEEKVKYILATLNELEYGSVVITVHESDITQIDITEKKRFVLNKKAGSKK